MGEHLLCKQGVKGSNPFISIRCFALFVKAKGSETSHPGEAARPPSRIRHREVDSFGLIAQLVRALG